MPHSMHLNRDRGVIVLRYRGTVDFTEIKTVLDELILVEGFRSGLCLVADFRQCRTKLTGADVSQLALYCERSDLKWGSAKWVLIATNDLTFGLSRMFIALTSDYQVTTNVFRNIDDADEWLGFGIKIEDVLAETPDRAVEVEGRMAQ